MPNPSVLGIKRDNLHRNVIFRNERVPELPVSSLEQPDPIGLAGGLNPYSYVANNPLVRSDPNGLCPWCVVGAGVGAGYEGLRQFHAGTLAVNGSSLGKIAVAGAASQMVFFVIMTPPAAAAQMTFAYDFGDVPLTPVRSQNASDAFTAAFPGMHQLPWIRAPQGLLWGGRVTVPIPYDAIISGMSVGNPLQAVPAQPPGGGAWLPIDIDLRAIYRKLRSA
mgnify:CR=1 FL=1